MEGVEVLVEGEGDLEAHLVEDLEGKVMEEDLVRPQSLVEGLEEEEVDLVLEQMLGLDKILELEVLVEAEVVGLEVGL